MVSKELILLYLYLVNVTNIHSNFTVVHHDFINELRAIILRINKENPYYDFKQFKGRLLSEYLSLSIARYKFCRDYVKFCETFVI